MDAAPFKRWLREPLVHFLLLGALLFLFSTWKSGPSSSGKIIVTRGRVEELKAGFLRTWQRPPTEGELKSLIDEDVKDEVSVREAVAKGIDLSDPIIRRRLRRKLELSNEEAVAADSPTDEDLRAYLKAHPESRGLQNGGVEGRLQLEREWRLARQKERTEEQFRKLLARYVVVIERPDSKSPAAGKKAP